MIVVHEAELSAAFEREWVAHHYRLALATLRTQVEERTVGILESTLAGREVREIAAELGMSEQAVYKAQQRLRERLQEVIAGQVRAEEDLGA